MMRPYYTGKEKSVRAYIPVMEDYWGTPVVLIQYEDEDLWIALAPGFVIHKGEGFTSPPFSGA